MEKGGRSDGTDQPFPATRLAGNFPREGKNIARMGEEGTGENASMPKARQSGNKVKF